MRLWVGPGSEHLLYTWNLFDFARRCPLSFDLMYRSNGFRKSTPPQNRQLIVQYYFTIQ